MFTKQEIPNTPIHNTPPPLIEVSGTHREMGRQIGEAARAQVQHSVANARVLIDAAYDSLELTWQGAQIQSRKYLPFAEERYPQYVDEMRGIAEGANVAFDDIVTLNAMEAVTVDALHLTRCTSMAVNEERTADGHVLAAHNEDWVPEDEDGVLVISAKPDKEPPFLAMTYGGLLPNVGFNAFGIAQLIDSVYPSDSRIGIPRLVVARAVLSSHRISGAIGRTLVQHRAAGYNHLLIHESGEMYSIEVSARKFEILYAHDGYMVHTNHYLDPQMKQIEKDPEELLSSRVRYFRASRLLRQNGQHTIKSLQAIQKDHTNIPNSICNHNIEGLDPLDREKTISALVIDLTSREMHITWGNPCQNAYHTYHLNA
ncbi:MAG TPA: C45 family autoproteolytic acyltransferase/hydrolase [Anaerolineales bacterium]|nr:C45 family autoproteolytic acyltransferase/hydrolase [Anaerolineales bacterium]HMV95910.1 C45 family autoproteolytic acyltransferase/hydrolase [Anaerolineales bacterium]HMX18973.1 C45 family autoproteolytic acyltransferase/hydrolase [Anaerolineales bacterium]HMX74370.1 C45 family autoproteolytic acyltransferase/hydrolase [Anaerolineales bacterium]HMZ42605.1 C45 family autoproteolytic acyltransferase/hydrolase [Anaerolineales bacterium]